MSSRILPLAAFLALVVLLLVGLKISDKKTQIPSPLIDKPVPAFDLPVLAAILAVIGLAMGGLLKGATGAGAPIIAVPGHSMTIT